MMYRLIHERDRLLEFRTQEVFKVSLRQGPYCPVKEQDCEAEDPPHHLFRGVVRGEVHRGGASGGVSESVMCMLRRSRLARPQHPVTWKLSDITCPFH